LEDGYLIRTVHELLGQPHALNPLALVRPRLVYARLFRAAADTLLEFARDPRHLGAEPGLLAVLHTWGQNLSLHIHLHCVVTAGGIDPTQRRWIRGNGGYLFPVRALSRVFRGKYLDGLHSAVADDAALATKLDWPKLRELLRLAATDLLQRFLLHVLPRGFQRVRHYGLLANRHKAVKLAACRRYFGTATTRNTDARHTTLRTAAFLTRAVSSEQLRAPGFSRLHASLYRLTGVQSPGWLDEPDGLSSTGFIRNAQRAPHKPSSLGRLKRR